MTRGDLVRHCALEFGLDRTASSDELLLMQDWANEAVRDVLIETRARVEIGDQALTIGVGDYRMDDDILAVDERTIEANTMPLELVSVSDMYALRRASSAGSEVTKLAAEGDLLMVWPAPSVATTIRYVYVAKPTEMTSDSHDPSNVTYGGVPLYAHRAILAYMRWEAAQYDERRAPHTPDQYRQFYDQALVRVKKRARHMAGHLQVPIKAGYPGTRGVARRNDVYPER